MVIFGTLGRCEQNYNSEIKICISDFLTVSWNVTAGEERRYLWVTGCLASGWFE